MASELRAQFPGVGTIYAIIRRVSDGYVWNGTAFETWADGSIGTYDVPLTSLGGDYYESDFPMTIAAGNYDVLYYEQADAAPAITDLLLIGERLFWDGANATSESTITLSTYALTTLASVKRHMRITSSAYDTLLTELINAVSAEIERVTGRRFAARNYRTWMNGGGQTRILLPDRPVQYVTRIVFGGSSAMTLTCSGSVIRATASVYRDPESPDAGGLRLVTVASTGATTVSTLAFSTYASVSALATAVNLISGWSATVVTDVPTADLIATGGESAKGCAVTLMYPDQDRNGWSVNQTLGTVEFSLVAGSWWPWFDTGAPRVVPRGHQYLLIEYRAGYETIPADVGYLCNDLVKEHYFAGKQNSTLGGYTLGPYTVTFDAMAAEKTAARLAAYMDGTAFVGGSV